MTYYFNWATWKCLSHRRIGNRKVWAPLLDTGDWQTMFSHTLLDVSFIPLCIHLHFHVLLWKPLLCGAQRTDFSSGHTGFLTSFYRKHSIFFFSSIKVQLLILLVLHPHVFPEMPSEIAFTSTNRTVSFFFFLFFKIDKTALKLPPVFCSCSFYLPE